MPKLVSHQPRYVLLAQNLMDAISTGKFPVGSLMPTEHDVALQYSMSRHTVREALRLLQERGMISRQAGVGTRVTSAEPISSYVQTDVGTSDLRRYVQDLHLKFSHQGLVVVDEALAEFLPAQPGQNWLASHGARFLDRQKLPIALSSVYVAPPFTDAVIGLMEPNAPIYAVIEERYDISIVEVAQTIEAIRLTGDQAHRLKCEPSDPALRVTRRYHSHTGDLVEVAVNIHPGSRFAYRSTLRLGHST